MKKLLLLSLLLFTALLVGGCTRNSRLKNLNVDELFTQDESSYFVFIYKDDCEECEKVKPYIEAYLQAIKENEDFSKKSTIYGLDVTKEPNSQVLRAYTGENGEGAGGNFFVTDVENWDELYIAEPASLISIRTRDGVKYAVFEAEGYDAITARLEEHLQ